MTRLAIAPSPVGQLARDQSRDDWQWACRLANAGYTPERIARLLARSKDGQAYSAKYQRLLASKGPQTAWRYAQHTAEKAVAFVKANPPVRDPQAARFRIAEIAEAADALDWSAFPGARRALEGLLVTAERLGSVAFGLSDRAWAELVGMNRFTLRDRRDELAWLGWVVRNRGDKPGRTSRYSLRVPSTIQSIRKARGHPSTIQSVRAPFTYTRGDMNGGQEPLPDQQLSLSRTRARAVLAHDAFRPDALGDAGWWAMAATAGVPPTAWDALGEIAEHFGADGTAEMDRTRHAQERHAFRGGDEA